MFIGREEDIPHPFSVSSGRRHLVFNRDTVRAVDNILEATKFRTQEEAENAAHQARRIYGFTNVSVEYTCY